MAQAKTWARSSYILAAQINYVPGPSWYRNQVQGNPVLLNSAMGARNPQKSRKTHLIKALTTGQELRGQKGSKKQGEGSKKQGLGVKKTRLGVKKKKLWGGIYIARGPENKARGQKNKVARGQKNKVARGQKNKGSQGSKKQGGVKKTTGPFLPTWQSRNFPFYFFQYSPTRTFSIPKKHTKRPSWPFGTYTPSNPKLPTNWAHLPTHVLGHAHRNGELKARNQCAPQLGRRNLAGVHRGVPRQQAHREASDDATHKHHTHVDSLKVRSQKLMVTLRPGSFVCRGSEIGWVTGVD